jgi:REP element-mobilizing transposase RayT
MSEIHRPNNPDESPDAGPPNRRRPTHGVRIVDGQPTIVFLTVCTKDRQRWLACPDVQRTLVEVWGEATAWLVGRFVLMPDHLHLFAGLSDEAHTLDGWVRYWKSQFSRRRGPQRQRWQADHWDTRVRSEALFAEKWAYVRINPVRAGLVERPEEWPFQGELFDLPWR